MPPEDPIGHRVDGCDVDMTENPTADDDIDAVVLFAGVPPEDVERHASELRELLS